MSRAKPKDNEYHPVRGISQDETFHLFTIDIEVQEPGKQSTILEDVSWIHVRKYIPRFDEIASYAQREGAFALLNTLHHKNDCE